MFEELDALFVTQTPEDGLGVLSHESDEPLSGHRRDEDEDLVGRMVLGHRGRLEEREGKDGLEQGLFSLA